MGLGGGGGVVATCVWCTFDLLMFKVTLGSFSALVAEWPVTRKWLALEQNGVMARRRAKWGEIWDPVTVVKHKWGD